MKLNTNDVFQNPDHLFHLILSFKSTDTSQGNGTSAIYNEPRLNAENCTFSSFECILVLSNALQQRIECYYPKQSKKHLVENRTSVREP